MTDGFSSRHRLIEYPEYLALVEQRGRLAKEQDLLFARRDRKVHMAGLVLGYGGATLGSVALLGWGWMLVRQRTLRYRAVAQLRDQIARDLHDDIGSNLGGIVLLSERWSRQSGETETREGFRAIKAAAEETSAAMQDIVWLIQRGNMGLRDLVARMRLSAQAILGDKPLSLTVDPPGFRDRPLSLFFRRHVFFSFKETLNNIRRHAEATVVEVRITIDSGPAGGRFGQEGDRRRFEHRCFHGFNPSGARVHQTPCEHQHRGGRQGVAGKNHLKAGSLPPSLTTSRSPAAPPSLPPAPPWTACSLLPL